MIILAGIGYLAAGSAGALVGAGIGMLPLIPAILGF